MEKESELDKILEKEYNVSEEVRKIVNNLDGGWWNYRLIEKENHWKNRSGKEYFEKYFEIHEVYYNKEDEICGWSSNPINLHLGNWKDVHQILKQIRKATKFPILKIVNRMDREELVSTMKTLKQYKEAELSNWNYEDLWKEIEK